MPTNSSPWEALRGGEMWRGRVNLPMPELPPLGVLAARGKLDGPRIAIFGAVHGDEYEGTAAIHRLFNELAVEDLDELAGLVVGVPVANGAAWQARTRTTPHDNHDLNRAFPGNPDADAPLTHRLAHYLFSAFIAPADVVIDLHSGGLRLVHIPMVGWGAGGDGRAEALARLFGLDFHPWQVGATPGVLTHEATRAGKIAVGAEWGGGGSLDPAGAGAYAAGVLRVWQVLTPNMRWSYESDTRPPLVGDYAATPVAGLFHPAVALGDLVEAGAVLGRVVDDLGQELTTLTAERAGKVAGLSHLGRIEAGDRYVYVG